MNCNVPTDIVFSFTGFALRGGQTSHHADGWGIAFFEGAGVRHFVDYAAAAASPVAELIKRYPIKSTNVIAHIRKATQGAVALHNCHPFVRELWGRYFVFAHNGDLKEFHPDPGQYFRPVGTTDSERAFCYLLESLRQRFGAIRPDLPVLTEAIASLCGDIGRHGVFNMMLSDGTALFTHCSNNLHYLVRQHPFTQAHLADEEVSVDFSTVTTPHDRVALITTEPLTKNERWTAIDPGTLVLFVDGMPAAIRPAAFRDTPSGRA